MNMNQVLKNFLKDNKQLINDFDFKELYKKAKEENLSSNLIGDMFIKFKGLKFPLSYPNILSNKYTHYVDLNTLDINSQSLKEINDQV